VVDEKAGSEIRVTVIATGFGEKELPFAKYSPSGAPITTPIAAASTRPVDPAEIRPTPAPAQMSGQVRQFPVGKPVRRMGLIVDDSSLDIPAFKRRGAADNAAGAERLEPNALLDGDDKLDVPTFLRKHLD